MTPETELKKFTVWLALYATEVEATDVQDAHDKGKEIFARQSIIDKATKAPPRGSIVVHEIIEVE